MCYHREMAHNPPIPDSDEWIMYIWRIRNRWMIHDIIEEHGIEWALSVIENGQGDFSADHYLECYETNNNN